MPLFSLKCFVSLFSGSVSSKLNLKKGQTVVEYTLMLALVISVVGMVFVAFHKKFLGGLFSIVGIIIGAGTPEP